MNSRKQNKQTNEQNKIDSYIQRKDWWWPYGRGPRGREKQVKGIKRCNIQL